MFGLTSLLLARVLKRLFDQINSRDAIVHVVASTGQGRYQFKLAAEEFNVEHLVVDDHDPRLLLVVISSRGAHLIGCGLSALTFVIQSER